ncbi:hypothetical protein ACFVUN_29305 [Kitasatospora griseola]|uniref:hypothetical protein n=1 Tax=Kitasatospora griseola TaxID=2064 RepID=UPI0036DAEA90
MTVRFPAEWCNTDLGEYRECAGTYERYPYDSVPPLDPARFTGSFDWLGGPSGRPSSVVDEVEILEAAVARVGLTLPADFLTYHRDERLALSLDTASPTGCWQNFSVPIPSPVESGAYLVRFFRDQQDCVMWYLYLRPTGETFVVHSWRDFEFELEGDDEAEPEEEGTEGDGIRWCAPSFEEFAHRYWVEGRIALAGYQDEPLEDPQLSAYAEHYLTHRSDE